MKNTVVIVAYNRPEYLKMCLEYIKQADGSDKYRYLFALDYGYDEGNLDIIVDFPLEKHITTPGNHDLKAGKQSFNVISGLIAAANMGGELTFYIEEDVFIGKDFFTFTEAIHACESDIFETILSGNVNSKEQKTDDLNAYYVKENHNVHQGIGNCFKTDMILEYIKPHYQFDYFRYPVEYVKRTFPESELNHFFSEQDGLIRRIIEQNQLKVAFSHVERCFHAGMYGYNRYTKLDHTRMNMTQRTKLIKEYAFNVQKLQNIAIAQNLVDDSRPVNLDTSHTDCYKIDTNT